jgi:hypothetical protein
MGMQRMSKVAVGLTVGSMKVKMGMRMSLQYGKGIN